MNLLEVINGITTTNISSQKLPCLGFVKSLKSLQISGLRLYFLR